MDPELVRQMLEVQPLLAIPIGPILQLASILGVGFFGNRGGGDDEPSGGSAQDDLLRQLFPELKGALGLENQLNLRNTLSTDPGASRSLSPKALAQLGIDPIQLSAMLEGSVPLRRAVNQLAFGLLPRFARNENSQRALADASRFERVGRAAGLEPFDPTLDPGTFGIEPPDQDDEAKIARCRTANGVPKIVNGKYVRCEFQDTPARGTAVPRDTRDRSPSR